MALTKVKGSGVEGITNLSNATFLSVNASEVATLLTSAVINSEGGAVTTNIAQGLLKQHATVQGTDTFATIDSFNCGSVTDHAVGDHSITASSAFRDSRACALGTTHNTANEGSSALAGNNRGGTNISGNGGAAPTTTVFRFVCHKGSSGDADGAAVDLSYIYVARLGDLA